MIGLCDERGHVRRLPDHFCIWNGKKEREDGRRERGSGEIFLEHLFTAVFFLGGGRGHQLT